MKRSLLFISIFLTLVVSPLARAESVPLTEQHINAIKLGCSNALQGMLRIEKAEAVTRVNRGREYETLLRLVAAFNSRVVLNKQEAPNLTSTAARMQDKFRTFQQHYLDYADKYDATLDVNCRTAPVTFYDKLNETRQARALVAADIRDMDALLNQYQGYVTELKEQLTKAEAGVDQ